MKKKVSMLLVFIIGLILFATSVLASSANTSGYHLLLDSIKPTILQLEQLTNCTRIDKTAIYYDDREVFYSQITQKTDRLNHKYESNYERRDYTNNDYTHYSYQDEDIIIESGLKGHYTTRKPYTNYGQYSGGEVANLDKTWDPIIKIADAAVVTFDMQNMITAVNDGSGGYKLTASISESQVPVLINAILSEYMKQIRYNIKRQLKDLYINSVSGNAHIDANKLVDKAYIKVNFTGTDEDGITHKISMEILTEVNNINSTVINKPDLTGMIINNDPERPAELEKVIID